MGDGYRANRSALLLCIGFPRDCGSCGIWHVGVYVRMSVYAFVCVFTCDFIYVLP